MGVALNDGRRRRGIVTVIGSTVLSVAVIGGLLASAKAAEAQVVTPIVAAAVPTFGLPQVLPTPTPTPPPSHCACHTPAPSSKASRVGSKLLPPVAFQLPGHSSSPNAPGPRNSDTSAPTEAPAPAGLNPSLPPSVAFLGPPGGLAPAGTLLSWPLFAGIDGLALLSVLFVLRKSASRTATAR